MSKSNLFLLYLSLFSLSIWIAFEIYHTYRDLELPEGIQSVMEPIPGEMDEDVIDLLIERRSL